MNNTYELLAKIGLTALVYLSPMQEVFIVMMIFVGFDLLTGIVASSVKGIPRSSRRARKSIIKLMCYLSAVVLAYLAEKAFDIEWLASHRFIGAFICLVEMVSVLENLAVISGKPIFLKIITIIRGKASKDSKIITEILNEKNNDDLINK